MLDSGRPRIYENLNVSKRPAPTLTHFRLTNTIGHFYFFLLWLNVNFFANYNLPSSHFWTNPEKTNNSDYYVKKFLL